MGMKLDMRKTGTVRKTKFSELTERSEVMRDERLRNGLLEWFRRISQWLIRTLMQFEDYWDTPLSLRLQVTLEWLTILHWTLRGLIVF